ncbi:MAG: hypothetical protein F6K11_11465 [Leptolyngbya sp. SIO3F4]|nr:hypothetical protein [Leptolyngbya sp. SIO3F4]
MKLRNLFLIFLVLITVLTIAPSIHARPHISWTYHDEIVRRDRNCRRECNSRVLGTCVSYTEICDLRSDVTVTSWDNYKELTREAMIFLSREIDSSRFRQCVRNGAEIAFGPTNPSSFALAIRDVEALSNVSRWPNINLQADWYKSEDKKTTAGSAYVMRVAESTSGGGLRWSSEINMTIMLGWLQNWYDAAGWNSAKKELAGVILHEFLHQMGHSHPNGYEDGNLITVAGDCIAAEGSLSGIRGPNGGASSSSDTTELGLTGTTNRPRRAIPD